MRWQDNPWSDNDHEWDPENFRIGIIQFADAIQVYSLSQPQQTSLAEVCRIFRCDRQKVIEAVDAHPWMLWSGPDDLDTMRMIEHDGE